MELSRGANTLLTGPSVAIAVDGARQGVVDLMAFQMSESGRVRSDADFIFFNQPVSPEGAVRLTAPDALTVDLATVPADVMMLTVAVALDDSVAGSLAGVDGLAVRTQTAAGPVLCAPAGLTTERAVVLLEIYRRESAWKIRNVSAGWDGGLADLVREHGVSVDDDEDAPTASPEPVTAAAPAAATAAMPVAAPAAAPAVGGLSFDKRERLNLRKETVRTVLLTKGAAQVRARVVLVMDKTGSMRRQYADGVVHRVVERMVPVALQLDDDGLLETYLYAESFLRLPDLGVDNLATWPETYLHLRGTHGGIDYARIGGANNEIPVLTEILTGLSAGAAVPTLVLFFTDGGFSQRRAITELIRRASHLPAFFQFVGVGKANYGLLTALDDLDGRLVDNVGFFELDDIDAVPDADLYARLLSEFPAWVAAARAAGVLRRG